MLTYLCPRPIYLVQLLYTYTLYCIVLYKRSLHVDTHRGGQQGAQMNTIDVFSHFHPFSTNFHLFLVIIPSKLGCGMSGRTGSTFIQAGVFIQHYTVQLSI